MDGQVPPTEELFRRSEELAQEAKAAIADLEGQKVIINEQIQQLQRIVRAHESPTPKRATQAAASRRRVSSARLLEGAKAILDLGGRDFTPSDLADAMGYSSDGPAREILTNLRDDKFVGFGKREQVGDAKMPTQHFIVVHPNPDAYVNQLEERVNGS